MQPSRFTGAEPAKKGQGARGKTCLKQEKRDCFEGAPDALRRVIDALDLPQVRCVDQIAHEAACGRRQRICDLPSRGGSALFANVTTASSDGGCGRCESELPCLGRTPPPDEMQFAFLIVGTVLILRALTFSRWRTKRCRHILTEKGIGYRLEVERHNELRPTQARVTEKASAEQIRGAFGDG